MNGSINTHKIYQFKRAIELHPNHGTTHEWYAHYLVSGDRAVR
jgi:hypothetical protein